MRKTIDLPDDLSSDLEKMSRELKIPQTTLLSIGGYQLVARYKMEGSRMFDNNSKKEDVVTLIDSRTTSVNIEFVRDHLAGIGTIKEIKVFGDQVPDKYRIQKVQESLNYPVEYRLILINDRGKEWWFAGCSCGYGGEGVGGTHEILTLLGVPFSWEKLTSSQIIEEPVDVNYSIYLTVSKMDSDRELEYQITFRNAADIYKFKDGARSLGYVGNSGIREKSDHWAFNRNFSLTMYSKEMDDQTFKVWVRDTLEHLVLGEFRGSIKEIES